MSAADYVLPNPVIHQTQLPYRTQLALYASMMSVYLYNNTRLSAQGNTLV